MLRCLDLLIVLTISASTRGPAHQKRRCRHSTASHHHHLLERLALEGATLRIAATTWAPSLVGTLMSDHLGLAESDADSRWIGVRRHQAVLVIVGLGLFS